MSETVEKIKLLETVKKRDDLLGIWRLTYKLTNRMGAAGFTARMIDPYTDPLTGNPRYIYNENGVKMAGYMIERQTTILEPRTSRQHAHIVDWLLGHPEVFVEQAHANLDEKYVKAKFSNPRITLVNLDHQDLSDIKDEDYIDRLVGRILLEKGPDALSLEKLRFVLAKLNLVYREAKYIGDNKTEKTQLRKRLKDYIRRGMKEAELVDGVLNDLKNAQFEYEIKEMLRLNIITNAGGFHKYEGNPLGVSTDSVIQYFTNNVDFYGELSSKLYKALKAENNT